MIPRTRVEARYRRHLRLRQKVGGTAQRPRMSVCMTGKHIYVQLIDDVNGVTLAFASTAMAARRRAWPVSSTFCWSAVDMGLRKVV